ncbi:hypothetical protein [Bifidobacterium tsurumiense]|nr:hypothetical protein [Bifidobacterium tsurumiense]
MTACAVAFLVGLGTISGIVASAQAENASETNEDSSQVSNLALN